MTLWPRINRIACSIRSTGMRGFFFRGIANFRRGTPGRVYYRGAFGQGLTNLERVCASITGRREMDMSRLSRRGVQSQERHAPCLSCEEASMNNIAELEVNGHKHKLEVDPARSLLSVLRDDLDLTGSK